MKRLSAGISLRDFSRPQLIVAFPDHDGRIWVSIHYGHDGSDPALRLDAYLGGMIARPFIALSDWQWDRKVARQGQR